MVCLNFRHSLVASGVALLFPSVSSSLSIKGSSLSTLSALTSRSPENITASIDFLWPYERPWYEEYQDTGPCGTNASVGSRTKFPLDSGPISLTIADDAYSIVFKIAYMDDPKTQADFSSEILSAAQVLAGHRCYTAPNSPSNVTAGTNATIQMQYISQHNGTVYDVHYACADITLVNSSDSTDGIICLNKTVTGTSPDGIISPTPSTTAGSSKSSSSLSSGAKAGIAVGSVLGGLAIIGALAFMFLRKRKLSRAKDSEAVALKDFRRIDDGVSVMSTQTGQRSQV